MGYESFDNCVVKKVKTKYFPFLSAKVYLNPNTIEHFSFDYFPLLCDWCKKSRASPAKITCITKTITTLSLGLFPRDWLWPWSFVTRVNFPRLAVLVDIFTSPFPRFVGIICFVYHSHSWSGVHKIRETIVVEAISGWVLCVASPKERWEGRKFARTSRLAYLFRNVANLSKGIFK